MLSPSDQGLTVSSVRLPPKHNAMLGYNGRRGAVLIVELNPAKKDEGAIRGLDHLDAARPTS